MSRFSLPPTVFLAPALALALGCASPPGDHLDEASGDPATDSAGEQQAEEARLRSLPYGDAVPVADGDRREGVVIHDAERALAGVNLFNPRHLSRAFLLDMEGEVLRRWSMPDPGSRGFHHIEPLDDGGLVVLFRDLAVARLDADSAIVWRRDLPVHHDVSLAGETSADGFWVLTRYPIEVERTDDAGERHVVPVLEDRLTRLSPDGEVLRHIELFPIFGHRVPPPRWRQLIHWTAAERAAGRDPLGGRLVNDTPPDVFHTNAVERLDRDVPGLGRRGQLLLSIRELDLVAVLDPQTLEVGWAWGPNRLQRQHHPTITPDGTVLIFDNGRFRNFSRVIEVDPQTREPVWVYHGDPPESFYSATRGAAQRLDNGHTLITESDAGRSFEVTPGGDTVWELLAPLRPPEDGQAPARAAVYRMKRLPPGWPDAPTPAQPATPADARDAAD